MSLTPADLEVLRARGIGREEAERQLVLLRGARHPRVLERPATVGDGIERLDPAAAEVFDAEGARAALEGRCTRFVPASGAASRMFRELLVIEARRPPLDGAGLERACATGDPDALATRCTLDGLARFAFHEPLVAALAAKGDSLERLLSEGRIGPVIDALLAPGGLGLAALPKALIPFHRGARGPVTAFDEQLGEAAASARDAAGRVRAHFTISPEHAAGFRAGLTAAEAAFRDEGLGRLEVEFSHQAARTDTLAVDEAGEPARLDGTLVLRPAGHGALLGNLAALGADLVFIKNIDNVQPAGARGETLRWVRRLTGRLVALEHRIHAVLRRIEAGEAGADRDAAALLAELGEPDGERSGDALAARLDRPIRVCGMVPNTGEPGGGPFWTRDATGHRSLQIVESAEIDSDAPEQAGCFARGTHFNPVFLACALRDHRGRPHDLARFVDPEAAIVTTRSAGARALTVLERPGLWNGAMARWWTVFVEVPIAVFTPVKTLNDLLRPEHQA